jgi:hypothetical protein
MSVDTVNRAEKMAFILPSLSCVRRYRHGQWLPCSFTSPHFGLHLSFQGGNCWRPKDLVADQLCPMGPGRAVEPPGTTWDSPASNVVQVAFGDAKNMPRGVALVSPNSRAEALGSVGRVLLPTRPTHNPLRFEFALPSSVKLSGD